MSQYIDKSVLVAEIKRRLKFAEKRLKRNNSYTEEGNIAWKRDKALYDSYNQILSFINTPEVKEIDLEEEINHWQGCEAFPEDVNITPLPKAIDIVERTARHFFELGLKAQKGE